MFQIMGLTYIHQLNILKTLLTGAINAVTTLIFIFFGKVLWSLALVMVCGAILGDYVGARLALKVSPNIVRTMGSCIGFSMTAYFFHHHT